MKIHKIIGAITLAGLGLSNYKKSENKKRYHSYNNPFVIASSIIVLASSSDSAKWGNKNPNQYSKILKRILEILKFDKDTFADCADESLCIYDIHHEINEILYNLVNSRKFVISNIWEKDFKNLEFYNERLRKDFSVRSVEYFNSVIRRSGIYLGNNWELMQKNLKSIMKIKFNVNVNVNSNNLIEIIDIISSDYHGEKKIYNELIIGKSDIISRINNLRSTLLKYELKIDNIDDLEVIVSSLKIIGYYDQEEKLN